MKNRDEKGNRKDGGDTKSTFQQCTSRYYSNEQSLFKEIFPGIFIDSKNWKVFIVRNEKQLNIEEKDGHNSKRFYLHFGQ